MFVDFWDVAATKPIDMPMSLDDISRHLSVDWIPSLPPADGKAFIGWPPFLIEALPSSGNRRFLTLRRRAPGSERQWKSAVMDARGRGGAPVSEPRPLRLGRALPRVLPPTGAGALGRHLAVATRVS
jgi:hypothetical protein